MKAELSVCLLAAALFCVSDVRAEDDCQPSWDVGIGETGFNNTVQALTVFDNGGGPNLYAGGLFSLVDGHPANGVARWDGSEWTSLGGIVGGVFSLASFDDGSGPALYAGGELGSMIERWDGSAWAPVGGGMDSTVNSLVVFDDGSGPALYAGGGFGVAGGQPAARVAKWDGTAWSPLGAGMNGTVFALTVFDDGSGPALYAGGSFTRAGDLAASRIAKWDGTTWTPLGAGTNGIVRTLATYNDGTGDALYVGGDFTSAGGQTVNRIARWDGANWTALGDGMNSVVGSLAVFNDGSGDALYAGGFFSTAGGQPANRVARWNGMSWSPLGAGIFGGDVKAFASYDDASATGSYLYVAGSFTSAGPVSPGDPAGRIATWRGCPASNTPPTAVAGVNQSIHAGTDVYLDGSESFDDNTPSASLAYAWTMDEQPEGSNADLTLTDADTAFPSFFADVPGTYVLSLVVTDDGGLTSEPSTVTVSSNNVRPTAVAGEDISGLVGSTLGPDGTGSFDPDVTDMLTFSWSIVSAPEGSSPVLSYATTPLPTFVPELEGSYTLQLVVNDGFEDSDPDQVVVVAITPEHFAQSEAAQAMHLIAHLPQSSFTNRGNRLVLYIFLREAIQSLQCNHPELAELFFNAVLERTDGCVLRGSPDGHGWGRDWVTDCDAQSQLYELVNSALQAIED